jgi:hypothetical protein
VVRVKRTPVVVAVVLELLVLRQHRGLVVMVVQVLPHP